MSSSTFLLKGRAALLDSMIFSPNRTVSQKLQDQRSPIPVRTKDAIWSACLVSRWSIPGAEKKRGPPMATCLVESRDLFGPEEAATWLSSGRSGQGTQPSNTRWSSPVNPKEQKANTTSKKKKKNKLEGLTLPAVKTYCDATAKKTVRYRQDSYTERGNRMSILE